MPVHPKHWNYFLAVEAELATCTRYVEFTENNYTCYSNEFAKLILLAASEVDSIFYELCKYISPSAKADRINKYYSVLAEKYPFITNCEVFISRHQLVLKPWDGWSTSQTPNWWSKSYNKLKHERISHLSTATLESALNAVGAQFLALQLYHHTINGEWMSVELSMRSTLYGPRLPDSYGGGAFWSYGDPFANLRS